MQRFQQMVPGRREALGGCLAAALLIVTGCGGPPKGFVSGKVIFRDQPVSGVNINFYSRERGTGDGMLLGETGAFSFADPLDIGPYLVFLSRNPPAPTPPGVKAKAPPSTPGIPSKYFDMTGSGLSYEVKPGKNEYLIELKEKPDDSTGKKKT